MRGPRVRALLITVAGVTALVAMVACSSSKPPPRLPPNVRMRPDGSCWYYPPTNCPPAHLTTCEAVPPQRVACPR